MTTIYNAAAKGTGSKLSPKIVVSGSAPHALFESTLVPRQRYESQDAKASFRSLMFKDARYVWSNQGGTRIYFLNPTSFKLCVSKGNFRDIGPEIVLQSAEGYKRSVYSALQAITNNRTRLGVLTQV